MRMLHLLLLILAVVPLSSSAQTSAPVADVAKRFSGTWVMNAAKSKAHASFDFKSATLRISTTSDTVVLDSLLETASGQKQNAAETFRTDGTGTPGRYSKGVVLFARWLGSNVLATVAEKDGQLLALVTYEVSADRNSLVARSAGTLEQTLVFDRVAP